MMQNKLMSDDEAPNLRITTTVDLAQNSVVLRFLIKGELEGYSFPPEAKQRRANELWKATCFELFLANSKQDEYYELNFSSSLEWNVYYLNTYRADVQEVKLENEPKIEVHSAVDKFEIFFELDLELLSLKDFDIYNVASILLTQENERTFWSVKHENDVPDFHHRGNFLKIK